MSSHPRLNRAPTSAKPRRTNTRKAHALCATLLMAVHGHAQSDDWQWTGEIGYTGSWYTDEAAPFGPFGTAIHESGKMNRSAFSVDVKFDGQLQPDLSVHGWLTLEHDAKDAHALLLDHRSTEPVRELYVQHTRGLWQLTAGKQRLDWGNSKGIRLLDRINPTDWKNFNPDTLNYDSLGLWMLSAGYALSDAARLELVLSEQADGVVNSWDIDRPDGNRLDGGMRYSQLIGDASLAVSATLRHPASQRLQVVVPTIVSELETSPDLGVSFTMPLPLVESDINANLYVEALYQKDLPSAVVDLFKLAIGDLAGALTFEDADWFSHAVGTDLSLPGGTQLNLQWVQYRNLDYVDQPSSSTYIDPISGSEFTFDTSRYSIDWTTVSVGSPLVKARQVKNHYSIALSHTLAGIELTDQFMYESGGGKWNYLGAQANLAPQTRVSLAWHKYWGPQSTHFGVLQADSSVQASLRHSF